MPYVPTNRMSRGFARIMAARGSTMTLKREGESDLTVAGKSLAGAEAAVGNATQDSFRVKIGAAEINASSWAVKAPKPGDRIVTGGRERSVLAAWPLDDSDATAGYLLEVAG
jgi:hypothetical protein